MKKIFLFLVVIIPAMLFAGKPQYDIKIKIAGLKDSVCYLAQYYGENRYVKDTAKIDAKGLGEFTGSDTLKGGIYVIIISPRKYFDVIIDKQTFFSLETDTNDVVGKMKVKGSSDNQLFYEYQQYGLLKQKEAEPFRARLKAVKEGSDSAKIIKDKLLAIDKEVRDYKIAYMKNHAETFLTTVFKASVDIEIPEAPKLSNGKKDSTFAYRYYTHHFFDNIPLTDDRLLRTPVFHAKLKEFITAMAPFGPDTVMKLTDSLVAKCRTNKEMFKYVVWYVTNWSETCGYMGYDAIFVHMAENYYTAGQAYWVSAANLKKITDRAKVLKNLLLGTSIPNLTAQDTSYTYLSLYNVKAKYTVLYFWDPTCGHCQKETPLLKAMYDSLKFKNLEVFALCTDPDLKAWKDYIILHKLNWINVMDMQNVTGFHALYDITTTPIVYLMDQNMDIIAKGALTVDQLIKILDAQFKKDEKKK